MSKPSNSKSKVLTIIDLVEILDRSGFKSVADLEKISPNPLLWRKREWTFAVNVIASNNGLTPKEVKTRYARIGEILQQFNNALRRIGLLVELEEVKKISEADLKNKLGERWDEEWISE